MAADTTVSLGIETKVIGAEKTKADLADINAGVKKLGQSTKELGATQQTRFFNASEIQGFQSKMEALNRTLPATQQSMTLFQRAMFATGQFFAPLGRIIDSVTGSMGHLAGAHGEAAKSMHLLNAVAATSGASLGGLERYTVLARGGIALLAAGVTAGLIISLEKSSDAINILKTRLSEIKGEGAARAFDDLKSSADKAKTSILDIAPAIERLQRLLVEQKPNWIFSPGEQDKMAGKEITTLSQSFQLAGQTASKAKDSVASIVTELEKIDPVTKKSLGLTQQLFTQIYNQDSRLGNALVVALGGTATEQGVALFKAALESRTKSLDELRRAIDRIGPATDKAFKEMPPTVAQSWDRLTMSVKDFWAELGQSKEGHITSDIFGFITSLVDRWKAAADQNRSVLAEMFSPPQGWATMFSQIGDLITNWVSTTATKIMSIAATAVSAIKQMLASVANIQSQYLAGVNTGGYSMGGPSFDASGLGDNIDQGSGLPQFASGGLAKVSGPTGTDKTLVQFMATNGEVVAIGAPGNASAARAATGGSSGASVSAITTPITVAINSSTSQIVSALNNNSASQASNAINSSMSSGGGSGGGGSIRIIPWKGNPLGTMSDYTPWKDIYGPMPYDTGTHADAVPYNYTPINDIGGGGTVDAQNANVYTLASGFNGYVGGAGLRDSKRVNMNLTPGELVSVTPRGSGGGSNGPVHLHFYAPMNAQSFVASQSQIKRAVQKAFR